MYIIKFSIPASLFFVDPFQTPSHMKIILNYVYYVCLKKLPFSPQETYGEEVAIEHSTFPQSRQLVYG